MRRPRQFENGTRFGKWTIVEAYTPAPPAGMALCRCDCGTVRRIQRRQLRRGRAKQCMACRTAPPKLIGKTIGPLVVTEVDLPGKMVVLECTRCSRSLVRDLSYARRAVTRGHCPHCDVVGSQAALARTGVSRQAIFARIASGWTREEATTIPKAAKPRHPRDTLAAQCAKAGTALGTYRSRVQAGYTHEQALTGDGVRSRGWRRGNAAPRIGIMAQCKTAGVMYGTYQQRLRAGYTHEQALTGEGVRRRGRPASPEPIHLRPFVSSGEVFKLPGSDELHVVPMQLFRTTNSVILRIGDMTYWFDETGKYDGPEMHLGTAPSTEKMAELKKLLADCADSKGHAPGSAYFEPGTSGHSAEIAGWPRRKLDS